jgi:hypothetical protein
MHAADVSRAITAAMSSAAALGLAADHAIVVQNSNRLVMRLLPCNILARVAPIEHQHAAAFELAIAQALAATACPLATPLPEGAPHGYLSDGFVTTLWIYYEPVPPVQITPAEYADALWRLHRGMQPITVAVPHFTDRIAEAQQLVANQQQTPALSEPDRVLLGTTLQRLRSWITEQGSSEQLLHGEPHPGNLLRTSQGLRFVDLETCCRGPVEFDIAHAPEAVGTLYPNINHELLAACRLLVLAMVAAWRWDRNDQFPNGLQMAHELLNQIRAASYEKHCGD